MPLADKIALQGQVITQLNEQNRRTFIRKVAADIRLSATAPTPPHLFTAIKNLLDLFQKPLASGTRRKRLVYRDDSQVGMLSVTYDAPAESPEIFATFAPLRDFIQDIALAANIESGSVLGADSLDLRQLSPRQRGEVDRFFELKQNPLRLEPELMERLLVHQQRAAQEELLSDSRISFSGLHHLYEEARLRAKKSESKLLRIHDLAIADLEASMNRWFLTSPIRLALPSPPRREGGTKLFREQVKHVLEAFDNRWSHICRPLLVPIALQVVYKPAPAAIMETRDLDNLMHVLLSQFNERFKPPANLLQALAYGDSDIAGRFGRLPPPSLAYSVMRMDVFKISRSASDPSDGFLVMGVASEFPSFESVWSRADNIIDRWEEAVDRHSP